MSHDLFAAARAAMAMSHSPYSRFPVGAALRDEHGRVHAGCNIENAAYPEGLCAEAAALSHLIVSGAKTITEACVVAENLPLIAPCGGCRQKLSEFASPDMRVWLCDTTGPQQAMTMAELLPGAFGGGSLA